MSADPGRRKGECVREKEFMTQLPGKNNNNSQCVREKEFMTQLPGKNNNNSLTPADARGSA